MASSTIMAPAQKPDPKEEVVIVDNEHPIINVIAEPEAEENKTGK